jgi:dienelactone hydrolase
MRISILAAVLAAFVVQALAQDTVLTQQEFVPKSGSGRVVVMVSGQTGPGGYVQSAQELANAGFDVVLLDGNQLWIKDTQAAWTLLKSAITRAQAGPHAQPGKAAVVGYSLGGGVALAYATRMPDLVETVVVSYPLTSFIKDPTEFVGKMKVPVLMLAGTADTYKDCCLIEKARQLEQAAKASSPTMLTLHEYAGVGHGFNLTTAARKDQVAGQDSMERTISRLREALPPTAR